MHEIAYESALCDYIQGYVIYSVRKKLKKQYIHLKGREIEKKKKSGVEVCGFGLFFYKGILVIFCFNDLYLCFQITDIILSPEVAFTGDTTSDFLLDPRSSDALRAKVLITEVCLFFLFFILFLASLQVFFESLT